MHAQELLALLGVALMGAPAARARRRPNLAVLCYVLLWVGLVAMGWQGAPFTAPTKPGLR